MAKTLNELASDLKECVIGLQSDAHNKGSVRKERYNNLKLSMDIAANPRPHVVISVSMSEAEFDLRTGEKVNGGLGPDERYVLRWFSKPNTLADLKACWQALESRRGKATEE